MRGTRRPPLFWYCLQDAGRCFLLVKEDAGLLLIHRLGDRNVELCGEEFVGINATTLGVPDDMITKHATPSVFEEKRITRSLSSNFTTNCNSFNTGQHVHSVLEKNAG